MPKTRDDSEDKRSEDLGFKVEDKRHWTGDQSDAVPDPATTSAEERQAGAPAGGSAQTLSFQAETKQLLDLMVHSLYSNKEIFLRELISNASDAIDRLRFEALTRPGLLGDEALEVRLDPDPDARTLTVRDNGIGMSREELIANLGTIAKSGTRELLDRLEGAKSSDQALQLIGQFGVGFYASFMVADRVTVITRRAGEDTTTIWESTGDGTYTIDDAQIADRGTSITLHLKPTDADDGLEDFTSQWVLERIVKKYSDFVQVPVLLAVTREEVERDEEGKPKEGAEKRTVVEDKTLNSMKAIWKRRAAEVSDEEYEEFYRHISHNWDKPLERITLSAEGRLEYQALLFVPSQLPFDFYYQGAEGGLQLYVRNVKIMDRCEELLPRYLRFVKGVVDSADLPLNVSREILQHDRQITQIRRGLVKKLLDTLKAMQAREGDDYLNFWRPFGRAIKEGVGADPDHKDKLLPLLMFESSADAEKLTTLAEYVARMKDDQEEIYYLSAESRAIAESSPHLEALRDRGYEVLFLVDPVDEFLTQSLTEFDGKKLKSVGKGDVELGSKDEREAADKQRKEKEQQAAGLLELLQKKLDAHVKEVRLSNRLTSSPVCLVGGEHDVSPHLERLLSRGQVDVPRHKRIMELNPDHALFAELQARFAQDNDDPVLGDYAELLLGQALVAEGSAVPDRSAFGQLIADLMIKASRTKSATGA